MTASVLYISYDGMLEPLGQSQVLAYVEQLAADHPIDLISFEKASDWSNEENRGRIASRCAAAGIRWHPMRYHKRPSALATAFDIAAGSAKAISIARRTRPAIVHARSYVPALMALAVKRQLGARFLFDMRGFWADERIDGGLWPRDGRMYRTAKAIETRLLRAADHVVTLTQASMDVLPQFPAFVDRPMPNVTVIPTCADLHRFDIEGSSATDPFILGHIGAVGTWYLLDEMVRCFLALREQRSDARWLIANRGEHDLIRSAMARHGCPGSAVELCSVDHRDAPALIRRMSAGMAIIKPSFSKISSAPTKLAEYLGCGVPCLGNAGVGDMEAILDGERIGIALKDFAPGTIAEGIRDLLALCEEPGIQARCRRVAESRFSLAGGVAAYREIYRQLAVTRPSRMLAS